MASATFCTPSGVVAKSRSDSRIAATNESCFAPRLCISSSLLGEKLRVECGNIQRYAPNAGKFSVKASIARNVDVEKVIPQGERVLIRLQEVSSKTPGGVLLPSSAVKYESYLIGEVISAGKDATTVSKGQKVVFSDMNAYEANLGNDESKLVFVRVNDLLGIVE